jgi:protein phosphatase
MRIGRVAALSDTGRRRLKNEDAWVAREPVFAVADGMGGAQAGEVASRLAAQVIEERIGAARGAAALSDVIREANERVFRQALADPGATGMGTTITAAIVDEAAGTIAVGHVGDSRGYRLRDGELVQLTADHSLVAELIRSGRLTAEEALQHPHRSVITRALGTEPTVEVDTLALDAEPGDIYILCSDGLTTMVSDEAIHSVLLATSDDLEGAGKKLIAAANAAGGDDNITVVLFEIVDGDPPDRPVFATRQKPEFMDGSAEFTPTQPRRFGAGKGSRWPAVVALAAGSAAAVLVVLWSLVR